MKKSNVYSKCLENLKTAFEGSSMDVTTTEDRIILTSKNGCFYQYLDIILDFDDESIGIEGYSDGWLRASPAYLHFEDYEGKDFSYFYEDITKTIITIYGETNNDIMKEMFNK